MRGLDWPELVSFLEMNSGRTHPLLTFLECLHECTINDEFVTQFNRLTGYRLGDSARRSPIQMLIDEATGFDDVVQEREHQTFRQFALFVKGVVWDRLPANDRQTHCWVPSGEMELPASA
jgi:hypothetical protein